MCVCVWGRGEFETACFFLFLLLVFRAHTLFVRLPAMLFGFFSSFLAGKSVKEIEDRIAKEPWGGFAQRVDWVPLFWRVPVSVGLSSSPLYTEGLICGMDISSGSVITHGLAPQAGENVLDLCCAPGTKLLLASQLVTERGTVTGVDVVEHRLNITRNVLRKYGGGKVRLFLVADGAEFEVLAPPAAEMGDEEENEDDQEAVAREPVAKREKKETNDNNKNNNEPLRVGDRVRILQGSRRGETGRINSLSVYDANVAPSFEHPYLHGAHVTVGLAHLRRVRDDLPSYDGVSDDVVNARIDQLQRQVDELAHQAIAREQDLMLIQALRKEISELRARPRSGLGQPKYGPSMRRHFVPGEGVVEWPDSDVVTRYGAYNLKTSRTTREKKKHRFDLPKLFWSNHHLLRINSVQLYDKVLVDAECTTDGAIHHHVARAESEVNLRAATDSPALVPRGEYRTDDEVSAIVALQKRLLVRGWVLLRPGGVLVYSTCSLLPQQNERVVEYLMEQHADVTPEPFDNVANLPVEHSTRLKHAIYFRPAETGGNAMFAIRLRKSVQ